MSESQSRYSIVERLTTFKLGFIDEKEKTTEVLEDLQENIDIKEQSLNTYKIEAKKDAEESINRNIKNREEEIELLRDRLTFKIKEKDNKLRAIETKIVEIDKAIRAIESISKTAPTPEEQATK